jgi:hypothetical protein
VSILAAGVQGNVQPAFDLITRNFGNDAADHFELALQGGPCGEDGATIPAPCFAVSQSEGMTARPLQLFQTCARLDCNSDSVCLRECAWGSSLGFIFRTRAGGARVSVPGR